MARPKNLYWDSCVFIRYITRHPTDCLADIDQYVAEAKLGDVKIHFSTIVFAEIRPRFLKPRRPSIEKFFADLGSSFAPFDPNPNVLAYSGKLRDHDPVNPGNPKIEEERKRSIGTPDAIHLATCLYLRDVAGIPDIVFHTFDEGRGVNWEGRCVPLIGFERWYPLIGASARSQTYVA